MQTIIVEGVYRDGVIRPQTRLDLPDDTHVMAHLVVLDDEPADRLTDETIRALYGKYAVGPSLIDALLAERSAERHRDRDARLGTLLQ